MIGSWLTLSIWPLEPQHVVAARLAKLARGGLAALREAYILLFDEAAARQDSAGRLAGVAIPTPIDHDSRGAVRADVVRPVERMMIAPAPHSADQVSFCVQCFDLAGDRISAGRCIPASSAAEAVRTAETVVPTKVGAAALALRRRSGVLCSAEVIWTAGETSPDFRATWTRRNTVVCILD